VIGLRLVMAAALALIAISGSVGLTPTRGRTEPASPSASPARVAYGATATPRTGCTAATAGPKELELRPTIGGQLRVVRVHLPTGYRQDQAVPLLLNLHGTGSTAEKQETLTGLDTTADADDFIVAYPQGLHISGTGFGWNIPGTPTFLSAGPKDLSFLSDLIGLLRHKFCVDPARVYASGFSGGARMVSQLACTPDVRLAGVVVAGGLRAPSPCHPAHPLAVLAFHGTADLSNPFNGHGQPYWTYSVPEAALRWARYDSCPTQARTTHPYPQVTVTDYRGCPDGVEVTLYALTGKGHRWPAAAGAFQPNEIAWRFLTAHVTPGSTPAI
jgi:polyhydroxybutyrate depolymerase